MTIANTNKKYHDGLITKPDYIASMYQSHHSVLFDYQHFIKNTDINKIEITADGVLFDCGENNIKIYGMESDYRLAPIEILNFSKYEPEETGMMLNLIPEQANIFDIGANAGWYSFIFAAKFPQANIFAFEPIPKTYTALQKNHELNKFTNISIFNFGLSNDNTDLVFYYYPEGSGNASSVNVSERKDIITINSKVKRLDDCFEGLAKSIDFIKCDVEGAELLVFQGAINTIKSNLPIVFSEILRKWSAKFDYHPNDIILFFKELNYSCFVVRDKKLVAIITVDEHTIETNYFFLHNNKHQQLIKKFTE